LVVALSIQGVFKMAKDEKDALSSDSPQSDAMSEDEIDNNLRGSFPASDPPSWTLGINHRQNAESEKDDASDGDDSK
jgi:hypothetical protein